MYIILNVKIATMNLVEKFKNNPKNFYYLIAAVAFVLINVIGLILYQSKNKDQNIEEIQAKTITETIPTPTDGPTPTD